MRAIVFGTLRFDRRSIPAELADVSQWPCADDSALDEPARLLFARRVRAMTLFVDGTTALQAIGRETGLRINDLYRLFERCTTLTKTVAFTAAGRCFLVAYPAIRTACASNDVRYGRRERCFRSTAAPISEIALDRAQGRRP
jgi:hypothetical protein